MKTMKALFALAALTLASSAFARTYTHEVQVGLPTGSFQTYKSGGSSLTVINARGNYARLVYPDIQAGGEVAFTSSSGGAKSTSAFEAFAFGNYNFDRNMETSFYAKGGLGMFAVDDGKGGTETKFGFLVGGGKRFPIFGNAIYNPEARLVKKGDLDPSIEIHFINVSILF